MTGIESAPAVSRVALMANGYQGLKPNLAVKQGDEVKIGQVLFRERRCPEIAYVAPASGVVEAIHRGDKRVLQSIVIKIDADKENEQQQYESYSDQQIDQLPRAEIVQHLLSSGFWARLRTRPYTATPNPNTKPHSIFVTATDTRPLAPNPAMIIRADSQAFSSGLRVLSHLTSGKIFVCTADNTELSVPALDKIQSTAFSGPHPAGLVGTHIHFLDPVSSKKVVWTIGYQDVIAIGKLFLTGSWPTQQIVSVAGPGVRQARLLKTRVGACVSELCAGNLQDNERMRVIAGSVLDGRKAQGQSDFLSCFDNQITVLAESVPPRVLGWLRPLPAAFSVSRAVSFNLFRRIQPVFSCLVQGSPRALVPLGLYEQVFPLQLLPTQLLRALLVTDTEAAQQLGCLELDEEDLALCSYVCPSKYEFGDMLRTTLQRIEKEG